MPRLASALVLVVAIGAGAIALLDLRPPSAAGPDTPSERFSASRAMTYVEELAREPRPTGSAANQEARQRLEAWLRRHAPEVETQEATRLTRRLPGWVQGGRVVNLVARLPGRDSTGSVLLMAHHDTVPVSPGAADDAAGVAALLETLRALAAGPRPRNDVVVLLTDGEEIGLWGAEAFLEDHRWAGDVEVVVNLEARGSRGASILFETGPVDSALMRRLDDAVPHLTGASYAYDVYRTLPNDTDFTVFRRAGRSGFNFAFIGDAGSYHSARDDVAHLDPDSLQHHGESALGMARHFGSQDLAELPRQGTAVYFNLPALGLVAYPTGWALPLALLALVATVAWWLRARRRHALSLARTFAALGWVPAAVAVGVAVTHGAALVARPTLDLRTATLAPTPWYLVAWALLAWVVTWIALKFLAPRLGRVEITGAAYAWWTALALGSAILLPSSSYLFVWPLLAALAAGLALPPARDGEPGDGEKEAARAAPALGVILHAVAWASAALLWVPTLALVGIALGLSAAPVLALGSSLLAVVLLGPFLPTQGRGAWLPVLGVATTGLAFLAATAVTTGHTPERPASNSLYYTLDTDTGQALWVSQDRRVDEWTAETLGTEPERRPLEGFFFRTVDVLASAAPSLPLAPARVERLGSGEEGGGEVRLRVTLPEGEGGRLPAEVRLALEARGGVEPRRLAGRDVPAANRDAPPPEVLEISFHGPPRSFEVVVGIAPGAGLAAETVVHRYGFPNPPRGPAPRPEGYQATSSELTDRSLVRASHDLSSPASAEDHRDGAPEARTDAASASTSGAGTAS